MWVHSPRLVCKREKQENNHLQEKKRNGVRIHIPSRFASPCLEERFISVAQNTSRFVLIRFALTMFGNKRFQTVQRDVMRDENPGKLLPQLS
ncbi:hypothetical protein TNIN_224641 [Trichonephila inaurata madagascariensis]|uniref:Uncharacterized protein n=1 Tax=Trichonephila inaurata madagascariensis TaxID=2747483 RepID=A0A8X7CIP1_9ARAC|nr:hypothetical protein TNIN_224641 [Trichonephila inaurata madagascariensis]